MALDANYVCTLSQGDSFCDGHRSAGPGLAIVSGCLIPQDPFKPLKKQCDFLCACELDGWTEVSAASDHSPQAGCRGTSLPRDAQGWWEEPWASCPALCWDGTDDGTEHLPAGPCGPWAGMERAGCLLTHSGCWWHRGTHNCFWQMKSYFSKHGLTCKVSYSLGNRAFFSSPVFSFIFSTFSASERVEGWKPQKALSWCWGCVRHHGKETLLHPVPPAAVPCRHLWQMGGAYTAALLKLS